nr:hypothetical protein [candidate division Zixibacteria bacterium]
MKRIILCLFEILFLFDLCQGFGIVSNGIDRDTLSMPFLVLDSLGNPVDLAAGDSAYLVVFYPGGGLAYRDSMAYNDDRIKSYEWEDFDGAKSYVLTEKVSVLDGDAPSNGVYAYVITVDDNTGADLMTSTRGFFQVVNTPLEYSLDSAAFARKAVDSINLVFDSLAKIIDSLEHLSEAVDSSTLAGCIWNTPQSNHTQSGTFGKYLDAEISGISVGGGAYSIEIMVLDTALDQPIPGVGLNVRNLPQTALIAVGQSDNSGSAGFSLNPDTFMVAAFAPGYIFHPYDTIVVTGPGLDTLFGYRFDPGEPTDPGMCRLYGFVYNISGNPESDAAITARLPAGVTRAGAALISPLMVETTSDGNGYFYLDLIPNTELTPDTTRYEITVARPDGIILRERVVVPDQSSWLFTW